MNYQVKQVSWTHGRSSLGHTVGTFNRYADAQAWIADRGPALRHHFTITPIIHNTH